MRTNTQAHPAPRQLPYFVSQILYATVVVALLGAAAPVLAQQAGWIQIAADQNNDLRVSVDPTRITRTSDGHIRAWTRWDYSRAQSLHGASYTRAMIQQEVNCRSQRTRIISAFAYNDAGAVVGREGSGSWEDVIPETVGDNMVSELCNYTERVQTPLPTTPVVPRPAAPARVAEPEERSPNSLCQALNGASLIADDGTFLGTIESRYASRSILNEYGTYGSRYNTNSIWNEYGQYGSQYSTKSAFNRYTTSPPRIVFDGEVLGYLTVNDVMQNAVDPALLRTCRF